MKSVKMQTILSAAVAVCAFLSTTYAHGAPLYSCVFENATKGERFEVRLREDGNEGTLAYKLPAELGMTDGQGDLKVTKTSATWSHFIFTAQNGVAEVELSVPASLNDNSIYMKLEVSNDGQTIDFIRYLNCSRAR
jgi:hypothetical protein